MSSGGRPFQPSPSPPWPSRISCRMRARCAGSWKRLIIASTPPACAHWGTVASRPLPLATYGYMSAVMSSPSARARSMRATTSFMLPHTARPATLRCQTSTGILASRPMAMASSSASISPRPSSRMCEA